MNSTVTMTFHDELMIFVLLLLFYLTVGLFRQMTERQYLQNFIDDQLIQPNPAPTECGRNEQIVLFCPFSHTET